MAASFSSMFCVIHLATGRGSPEFKFYLIEQRLLVLLFFLIFVPDFIHAELTHQDAMAGLGYELHEFTVAHMWHGGHTNLEDKDVIKKCYHKIRSFCGQNESWYSRG